MDKNTLGCRPSKRRTALEERHRLARDLHDSLLQSLTGMALRLEVVQRLLARKDYAAVYNNLEEIQLLMVQEQAWLRRFIRQLQAPRQSRATESPNWELQIAELARRVEQEWGLPVIASLQGLMPQRHGWFTEEMCHLIREALINCARHAGATHAELVVEVQAAQVQVWIKDDGQGFAFQGRYEWPQLISLGWGPKSLKERLIALGGQLVIESSTTGSYLQLMVPIPPNREKQLVPAAPLEPPPNP